MSTERPPATANVTASPLWNKDLAPTPPAQRTWGTYNFAALWISMSINLATYILATGLIQGGMNWRQALLTVFLGTCVVLVPMLLNGHPGTRYGIPFPILARASFGVLGANIPALARAFVACGWFGIQTWMGGEAISSLLATLWPAWRDVPYAVGICFFAFWCLNVAVILRGMEHVRLLQAVSAPVLLLVGVLALSWAWGKAGGLGPMLQAPTRFATTAEFVAFLIPGLNGVIGLWATLSLNIPDFTRFGRSQRAQLLGQAIALPITMTAYAFVGIAVASATVVIYGAAVWDPIELVTRFDSTASIIVSLLALMLATLNINIGANIVSPANDFSNLWPRRITFTAGGVITCLIGIAMMPWKLLADHRTYIFGWLGGYSAVLGPVAGIMICDYFVIRHKVLLVDDLYLRGGAYEYHRGVNWRAVAALLLGIGVALLGLAIPELRILFDYSWLVGFAVAFASYWLFMGGAAPAAEATPMAAPRAEPEHG